MLRESDGYVSGQQLCEKFQVSRTAVWKVMEQLKEEGYQIEAVRNRGYRLSESPDILSQAEIESRVSTRWAGRNVSYFRETDSTNTQAKRLGEEGAPAGTLVAADRQMAGKGRRGRSWDSPPGRDIYMSLLLRPDIRPSDAPYADPCDGLERGGGHPGEDRHRRPHQVAQRYCGGREKALRHPDGDERGDGLYQLHCHRRGHQREPARVSGGYRGQGHLPSCWRRAGAFPGHPS